MAVETAKKLYQDTALEYSSDNLVRLKAKESDLGKLDSFFWNETLFWKQ